MPVLAAAIFTWFIQPRILIHLFGKEKDNKNATELVAHRKELELKQEKLEISKILLTVAEEEEQVAKKTVEAELGIQKSEQQLWDEQLKSIDEVQLADAIKVLTGIIYTHGGSTDEYWDSKKGITQKPQISQRTLAFAHTNGLVNIRGSRVELTEKGKYFLAEGFSGVA